MVSLGRSSRTGDHDFVSDKFARRTSKKFAPFIAQFSRQAINSFFLKTAQRLVAVVMSDAARLPRRPCTAFPLTLCCNLWPGGNNRYLSAVKKAAV